MIIDVTDTNGVTGGCNCVCQYETYALMINSHRRLFKVRSLGEMPSVDACRQACETTAPPAEAPRGWGPAPDPVLLTTFKGCY